VKAICDLPVITTSFDCFILFFEPISHISLSGRGDRLLTITHQIPPTYDAIESSYRVKWLRLNCLTAAISPLVSKSLHHFNEASMSAATYRFASFDVTHQGLFAFACQPPRLTPSHQNSILQDRPLLRDRQPQTSLARSYALTLLRALVLTT